MQVDLVIDRLKAMVPALDGRVRGAGDFAAVLSSGSQPQAPLFAHVLYAGVVGIGAPAVATGAYRQEIAEGINVMLTIRSNDRDGQKALDDVQTLTKSILDALCGWAPGEEIGVFKLVRSGLVQFDKGVMRWQIDLTITDQLRIIS